MVDFNKKSNKLSYNDQNRPYQTDYYNSLKRSEDGLLLQQDISAPLSFKDWLKQQQALEPNSQYDYYLSYVSQWYEKYFTKDQIKAAIKANYINLLKQLDLSFNTTETEQWFKSLNIQDDLDIQDMIDFYSKKLKDIAILLSKQREKIKTIKTKYNTIGSNYGIQKSIVDEIYNQILQNNIKDLDLNVKVIVKELYDETNYFDKSPNKDVSTYFNLSSNSVINTLTGLNLKPEDSKWVYNLGSFDVQSTPSQNTDIELKDYANISENVLISDILVELTEKFLGESLFNLKTIQQNNSSINLTYNFVQGNNWFYWPSGEFVFESSSLNVNSIPLSATSLLYTDPESLVPQIPIATAGVTYKESDRIFVIDSDQIQGAWAHATPGTTTTETMSAVIQGSDNLLFKYPYPGYGDASSTLPWTGKTHENVTSLYRFLDRESQNIIEKEYFNDTSTSPKILTEIPINETTLVQSGAKAGKQYKNSDHIVFARSTNLDRVRDSLPDTVFTDDLEYAWLYDFTKTSINANIGTTNILWPLTRFDDTYEQKYVVSEDFCTTIPLSTLNHKSFIGARAGSGLYDSDVIYVREGLNGALIQAAWLSGKEIKDALKQTDGYNTRFSAEISGVHQPGLFTKCFPGQYTTFIWADSSIDINNTTITYHEMPEDSTYRALKHYSIFKSRLLPLQELYNNSPVENAIDTIYSDFGIGPGIGDWKSDESRTVLYSPIGHPGATYNDYERMCDIIFVDHTFPETFSLAEWKDSQGRDYTTSPDFAWYKLEDTTLQPDIGWGKGKWVNFDGTTSFILSAGYQYKYLRTNLRRSPSDIDELAVPYMVIKQPYTIAETKWIRADFVNGAFVTSPNNNHATIVLKPNDILVYDHYNTTTYCLTATDNRETILTTDYPKASSTNFDKWLNYNILESGQTLLATWPNKIFFPGLTTGPSPLSGIESLFSITWYISNNADLPFKLVNSAPGNLLALEVTAGNTDITYLIRATGYALSSVTDESVSIPVETHDIYVTAVPITSRYETIGSLIYETIDNITLPVNICVGLSGWDIQSNSINYQSSHAKPIWVTSSDEDNTLTKNKGVPISDRSYFFEHEVSLQSQPDISDAIFTQSTTLDYKRVGSSPLYWIQPLTYTDSTPNYQWKKLKIFNITNPLSSFTCEQFETFKIQETDEISDIVLKSPDQSKTNQQYINYFATTGKTWVQNLTLKSPIASQTYTLETSIIPNFPALQLLNRHYPTVASIPYTENIKDEDEISIFKPSNLGISVYFSKHYNTKVNTDSQKQNNIQDPNIYESDYGLTKQLNESPIERNEFDARWMKVSPLVTNKAGYITNIKSNQKFTPYQTSYENNPNANIGINHISDFTDPWVGPLDNDLPDLFSEYKDFRGYFNYNNWYNSFVTPISAPLYNWSSDIYGNQYGLFKNIHDESPYDQLTSFGSIWCRTAQGTLENISTGLSFLGTIFSSNTSLYVEIINENIQQFFAVQDLLVVATCSGAGIAQIAYDYNTNNISISNNNYNSISFQQIGGSNLMLGKILYISQLGKIFFPATTIPSLSSSCIHVFEYDIANKSLKQLTPNSEIIGISEFILNNNLIDITYPTLTYSANLDRFNLSFICRKPVFDGDSIISITYNIENYQFHKPTIDKIVS